MRDKIGLFLAGAVAGGIVLIFVYFVFFADTSGIVSTSLGEPSSVGTGAGTRSIIVNKDGLICAEPSPDIMVSLLTNVELSGEGEQGEAGNAKGIVKILQESDGEQIFQRSQGIQALRDGMYRLCEAHLNKAIPQETYVEQMTDLVATLNFIVPIELCSKLNADIFRLQSQSQDVVSGDSKSNDDIVADAENQAEETPKVADSTKDDTGDDVNGVGSENLSDMRAFTVILAQCIQTSFEFGRNIAINSGQRGKARLEAQQAMRFSKFRIAYALRERGLDCAQIAEITEGEIVCDALGIRNGASVVAAEAAVVPAVAIPPAQ